MSIRRLSRHAWIVGVLFLSASLHAEEEEVPRWMIRTELLVAEVPQALGLPLRSQLRNDATVMQGVGKLSSLIGSGQAKLIGAVTTWSLSGDRSVSEAVEEIRYQTEFNPPVGPMGFGALREMDLEISFDAAFRKPSGIDVPTSFETRNTGVTLEAEANAFNEGRSVHLSFTAQRVQFLTMRPTLVVKRDDQRLAAPIFRNNRTTTQIDVASGAWKLVAFHLIGGEIPAVEFMLIRATAIPTQR